MSFASVTTSVLFVDWAGCNN